MAVSKQPSITPETSIVERLDDDISSRGEAKWKRFHPFRVVRKIFRRRVKREGVSDSSKKSWSTSELQSVDDDGVGKCEVTSPLKIGLSVSHDSIFSNEKNASNMGSETLNVPHGSSLSIQQATIKNMFKDELFNRVRARRDSDDDIEVLCSPCTSPTTIDALTQGLKENIFKSQTTTSAGSLISMCSSENDEDSTEHSSGNSSRMSLIDRKSLDSDGDLDLNQSLPLNHNAAHHKIAIKPKRTHGLPRRRKNQVVAANLNTLPSTPEVVEDNGKFVLKLETNEVPQRMHESTSQNDKTSTHLLQSPELKMMHTSFSCCEMSTFNETLIQNKTSVSESNVSVVKGITYSDSKCYIEDHLKKSDCKKSNSDILEQFNLSNDKDILKQEHIEEDNYRNIMQTVAQKYEFIFQDVKQENIYVLENNTSNILQSTEKKHIADTLSNQIEEPINVSSTIKSTEKPQSFKNMYQLSKSNECIEDTDDKKDNKNGLLIRSKPAEKLDDTEEMCDIFKEISTPVVISNIEKPTEYFSASSFKENSFITQLMPDVSQVNIDCEFILKPLKKGCISGGDLESVSKEIISVHEKENASLSSNIFEEENIMTSKTLSMGVEEGGIFVSHHASVKSDLKDILVTEAHNYAAVEEKNEIYIQKSIVKNNNTEIENNESWISSIGISSTKPDITVNSSFTKCNSKMLDDKITISVNSKQTNTKPTIDSEIKKSKNVEEIPKSTSFTKPEKRQKVAIKETMSDKAVQKANFPVEPNISTIINNTNSQKRVSVEIVPFSQRMKERKYQPIIFANKEVVSDKEKKISNTLVERKLSDRKIIIKGKEVDKPNSRHSFSGVILADKSNVTIDKNPLNLEKVQYPVQIRIHKTNPIAENKDKIYQLTQSKDCTHSFRQRFSKEEKSQIQTSKTKERENKSSREERIIAENTMWEVKIQPAVTHSIAPIPNIEENYSSSTSEKQLGSKIDSQTILTENKDTLVNQDMEVSTIESNCKVSKEMPVLSDEPELLRVFARRSIKQKHCDKVSNEKKPISASEDSFHADKAEPKNVSHSSTVIEISQVPHIKLDLNSKSFSERISTRSVSPLKENIIHRESSAKSFEASFLTETTHPRQRIVNIPDLALNSHPEMNKSPYYESRVEFSTQEHTQQKVNLATIPQSTSSVNGSPTNLGTAKDTHEILSGKEAHAPSWLQLAQQRRELREQRERLLLGGSPNSFLDASNKPSRSSKVWDMVNNFQKLQMT